MLILGVANEDDKRQAFSNVFLEWPHAETLEEHTAQRLKSVQHQKAQWHILKDSETEVVISSLGAYPYSFVKGQQSLPGITVGAVHTLNQHRGQGYAAKLMDYLISSFASKGIATSLLFSEIGTAYYQNFQYQPIASYAFDWQVSDFTSACVSEGIEIYTKESLTDDHFAQLSKLYQQTLPDYVRTERNREFWTWGLQRFAGARVYFWTHATATEPKAFGIVASFEGNLSLISHNLESLASDDAQAFVKAILTAEASHNLQSWSPLKKLAGTTGRANPQIPMVRGKFAAEEWLIQPFDHV